MLCKPRRNVREISGFQVGTCLAVISRMSFLLFRLFLTLWLAHARYNSGYIGASVQNGGQNALSACVLNASLQIAVNK